MKKVIKVLALVLALSMVVAFAACGGTTTEETTAGTEETTVEGAALDLSSVKIGFICLHDENSTYDKNFIDAAKEATSALGLTDEQVVIVTNIAESSACYDTAADLVDQGCNIVFANSFGHEDYIIQAAKEYTDVQFCHATGTKAHTEGLANYHNAFASIYEGRFLAGIAAGLKLNEMIAAGDITAEEAKMGYVGAFTYAEVVSGYTSFYLGAKSVCPSVTMDVQFTGSWYDEQMEKEAAVTLIERDCVLISQHADSMGAPTACETAGVPNVSYNGSTVAACPETFIVSSRINWAPYYEYIIKAVAAGEEIAADWCGGIEEGSVVLSDINENAAAEGTAQAIEDAKAKILDGTLNVFDTATFTKDGEAMTSYMADVDTDTAYEADTEVIADGYFHESEYRSAPYFDVRIDGINLLNEKF